MPLIDSLEHLRKRFGAATPGCWLVRGSMPEYCIRSKQDGEEAVFVGSFKHIEDAQFAASWHNWADEILAHVDKPLLVLVDGKPEPLAARDERMKRKGAAEWLGGFIRGLSDGNPGQPGSIVAILEEELKRLREGK